MRALNSFDKELLENERGNASYDPVDGRWERPKRLIPDGLAFSILLLILFFTGACSPRRASETTTSTPGNTTQTVNGPTQPSPGVDPGKGPGITPGLTPPAMPEAQATIPAEFLGFKVVYIKEERLWIWTDGQARQLSTSGPAFSPKISPDGVWVVFQRPVDDYHVELWAIRSEGTDERRLVSVADLDQIGAAARDPSALAINPYRYQWIPGTHTLAFNTYQLFQGPGMPLLDDLNLVDLDTGELTFLLLAGWGGDFVYSPDGGQIAISQANDILLLDADGSNYRSALPYEAVITYSEYSYYAQPQWEPGGGLLRVSLPPVDPLADPPELTELWEIPASNQAARLVGTLRPVPFFDSEVSFSPDLSHLAYLTEAGQPSEIVRELHIVRGDGSEDRVYQSGAMLQFLGWGSDSRQFVYSVGENQQAFLGSLERAPVPFSEDPYGIGGVRWVDGGHALYYQQIEDAFQLTLWAILGERYVLDMVVGASPGFDFAR